MAQRIDDASNSHNNLKYNGPETMKIANDIAEASNWLSIYVKDMAYDLDSFVSALEEIQVKVRVTKERSLIERIRRWLKSLFKAIAAMIAVISPLISDTLCIFPLPATLGCAVAVTVLGKAASAICARDSGALLEYSPPPARTEVIDPLMQNPRRASTT
jgi:polyphosphate kinase